MVPLWFRSGADGFCLASEPARGAEGEVSCRLLEALPTDSDCARPGRRRAAPQHERAARRRLEAADRCGEGERKAPCETFTLCEIEQLVGEAGKDCRAGGQVRGSGFCFLDDSTDCWGGVLRVASPPVHPLPAADASLVLGCDDFR